MRLTLDLNLKIKGTTQYTNYDFNSLVNFNGKQLGAKSDGLMVLEGDTDLTTKINAYFEPIVSNFGSLNSKRMRCVDLGYRGSNLQVVVTVDDDQVDTLSYSNGSMLPSRERKTVSSGLQGVYWKYQIKNVNGADFTVDQINGTFIVRHRGVSAGS